MMSFSSPPEPYHFSNCLINNRLNILDLLTLGFITLSASAVFVMEGSGIDRPCRFSAERYGRQLANVFEWRVLRMTYVRSWVVSYPMPRKGSLTFTGLCHVFCCVWLIMPSALKIPSFCLFHTHIKSLAPTHRG